jgi:hypothetical protein
MPTDDHPLPMDSGPHGPEVSPLERIPRSLTTSGIGCCGKYTISAEVGEHISRSDFLVVPLYHQSGGQSNHKQHAGCDEYSDLQPKPVTDATD